MIQCLLVEDDIDILELVTQYLQGYGMAVTAVSSARQMDEAMKRQTFDVILLDLMLPDANGLELCRQLRARSLVPVIMLTAQGDPVSRVVGLEIGADDYIGKPFEPRELVARIHAVLRRLSQGHREDKLGASVVMFQGWMFDRLRRQLTSPDGVVVHLSAAEFRLLSVLVDRAEAVLTREQLIELTVTPGVLVNDRSVDLTVSRLRQKLRDSSGMPSLIRTVRGEGYMLAAKVCA